MPITLNPLSRRRFLAGSLAAGTAAALSRFSVGAAASNADRFALFSDTHIDADPMKIDRMKNMSDHLRQAVSEVLKLEEAPSAVLVNGDCAHLQGLPADYAQWLELLKPLREAGLPIHANFGNHDHRANFWESVPADQRRVKAVEDRQVLILESPRADWIMLDSLDVTNKTPGVLGAAQIEWLAKELDNRQNHKVIVMVHHQPDERPQPQGLTDTKALLDTLVSRKQVKALLYGHTHVWKFETREGLHCVNLPAVAYPFAAAEPTGWVDARLSDAGMTLKLNATDAGHPKQGDTHELAWR